MGPKKPQCKSAHNNLVFKSMWIDNIFLSNNHTRVYDKTYIKTGLFKTL